MAFNYEMIGKPCELRVKRLRKKNPRYFSSETSDKVKK